MKTLMKKFINGGVPILSMHTERVENRPDVILVLPFGTELEAANSFIASLDQTCNLYTWQSRHILDDNDELQVQALTMASHAADLEQLIEEYALHEPVIVGYCSGAAVALHFAARSDNYQALFLVFGEYALAERSKEYEVPAHYFEVDTLLRMAAKSRAFSTMLSDKMSDAGFASQVADEARFFNKPYFNELYLHRYALNYLDFVSHDYLDDAKQLEKHVYVYCSDEDKHVGTDTSVVISNALKNSTLVKGKFGDHYAFCRPETGILQKLKKDISHEISSRECLRAV